MDLSRVSDFFTVHSISDTTIWTALSGGPDSVFLLHSLCSIRMQFNLKIKAAFVNHGIRSFEENSADTSFVKSLCHTLGVPLEIHTVPQGRLEEDARQTGCSVEGLARNVRYSFFESLIQPGEYVALGHNRDDLFETMVMRFFHGSSPRGLKGMDRINGYKIRPILDYDKKDIVTFLDDKNLSYRIDVTNNTTDYLRNGIRHELMPVVAKLFPGFKNSLGSLSSKFSELSEVIEKSSLEVQWEVSGRQEWSASWEDFYQLPFLSRKEALYRVFNISYRGSVRDFRLPERFLFPLKTVKKDFHGIILDGYGFRLIRKGDKLFWRGCKTQEKGRCWMVFHKPAVYTFAGKEVILSKEPIGGGLKVPGGALPLILRSPEKGDGVTGILKKKGYSLYEREAALVLENRQGILAALLPDKILFQRESGSEFYIRIKGV